MPDKTILLADDEKIILESLAQDLKKEAYSVVMASNGEEAIALLKDNQVDLVVTDLIMPDVSGIEVLRETKKKNSFIGVIILTGYGDLTSAIEALRLGADDYLLKPCQFEELILRIERCLEKQEALQKIKIYEEILPVCCVCGDIRDDRGTEKGKGVWMKSAEFIIKQTSAQVTHTYCHKCYQKAIEEDF